MHLKKKLTFFLVLSLGLLALTQARSISQENEIAELPTTTVTNVQETVSEAEQPEEIGLLGCGGSCGGFPFGGHFDAQQFQSQFQNGGWGGSQFQSQSSGGGSQFQSQSQSGEGGSQYQIQSQSGGGSQIQIGGGGSQFQSQSGGGGNQFQSQYSGW